MKKSIKYIPKIITIIILAVVALIIINMRNPLVVKATAENLFGPDITFESIENKDSSMPYVLYKPSTANGSDSLPLILWLHGLGERGYGSLKDFKTRGLPPLFEGDNWKLEGFNAYILCPQTSGYWNSTGEKEKLKNLLEEIIEQYNIDKNQIIISGHSMGGRGTLYMAHQLPGYFAKAAVLSGYPTDDGSCIPSVNISEINIPIRGYVGKRGYGEDSGSIQYMEDYFEPTFGSENTHWIEASHPNVPKVAYNLDEDGNGRSDLIEWMFDGYTGRTTINKIFNKDITYKYEFCPEPQNSDVDYGSMQFSLFTPSTATEKTSLPLIIWLHGKSDMEYRNEGEARDRGWPGIFKNWEKYGLDGVNAYVLAPLSMNEYPWTHDTDVEQFKQLLDGVIKEKNIDKNNIFLTGHSSGVNGAIYISLRMPEYFSKNVFMSGFGFQSYCTPEEYKALGIKTRAYTGSTTANSETPEFAYSVNPTRSEFMPLFGEENTFFLDGGHNDVPAQTIIKDDDENGRSDVIEWLFNDYKGPLIVGVNNISTNRNKEFEDIISPMTELDTKTGIIIEPLVEFVTFILDSLFSLFTSIMTQTDFQNVMGKIDELPDLGPATITYTMTEEELNEYRTASGALKLSYPKFIYSLEEIFSGKIDLLNVNFIMGSNNDEGWNQIRNVITQWYKILRMIAIIGLLAVLIYTGIKIILSSNAKDKAKYKQLLGNWFIAIMLAFFIHYIMAFILTVAEQFTELLNSTAGIIQVNADKTFNTNLLGLARFQMQQQKFTDKIGHLIIYTALVTYTIKFTFVYLKRVLNMAFLTIISPIVALTYPIDKMNGEAKGFNMWLKEYIYNALLQPMHYILYYILITTSLSLAATNQLYGIAALAFLSHAERLLKRIFGFDKAGAGTVGGVAGAFATGAVTSSLMNYVRDPMHPFGGGNSSSKSGEKGANSNSDFDNGINPQELAGIQDEDVTDYNNILEWMYKSSGENKKQDDENTNKSLVRSRRAQFLDIDDSIFQDRLTLSDSDLGKLEFSDGDPRSILDILKNIAKNQGILEYENCSPTRTRKLNDELSGFENQLSNRIDEKEKYFDNNFQYTDGDKRSTSEILDEIKRLNKEARDPNLSEEERNEKFKKASKLLRTVERRLAENQYLQRHYGPEELKKRANNQHQNRNQNQDQNQNQSQNESQSEKSRVIKGVKNAVKTMAKPIYDEEKDDNAKRLVGNIIRGTTNAVIGGAVGVAAAAVQAGISITDGKYSPAESAASIGAGIAGVSGITKKVENTGKKYIEENQTIEEYARRWYNRDDVISCYNREFPDEGKAMRQRARENYITRGITDQNEQIKAIKYANKLKKQKGLSDKEADRIAITTLQYKKSISNNYAILYDEKKRKKYLDAQVDAYVGSASKDRVRRMHEDLIESVKSFDKANR